MTAAGPLPAMGRRRLRAAFVLLSGAATTTTATNADAAGRRRTAVAANPNNYHCSADIIGVYYTGECGAPCPSGFNDDCPDGQRCYGPLPDCVKVAKYCGAAKRDAASACAKECFDEEDCDEGERCWDVGESCSVEAIMVEQRRDVPNPYNYFCGSGYVDAATQCDTNYYAIPCPPTPPADDGMLVGCPPGQYCYGNLQCTPVTEKPSEESAPGESGPAVGSNPAPRPTEPPTVDRNPGDKYCSSEWRSVGYEGECGRPCPSGSSDECPKGEQCWGPIPNCTPSKAYGKIVGGSRWCGADFSDMAAKCSQECPNGTDEECGAGEKCFNGSPCQFDTSDVPPTDPAMLWCGRSHMHLLENCPKRCEGGSDDECGMDEEGNQMKCFNMQSEETPCATVGVGVKEPTDPANLWCGSNYIQLLENCQKACPDGDHEACGKDIWGKPMKCYDMTANGEVCQQAGKGIKERGDINKRFCGESFSHMMETCPERCMDGNCPDGMTCFEDSPCLWVGKAVDTGPKKDPSKMFCGKKFADARSCTTACPGGSSDECPGEELCFSDVEGCKSSGGNKPNGKSDTSNNLLDWLAESEATPLPEELPEEEAEPANVANPVPSPAQDIEVIIEPAENEQVSLNKRPASSDPLPMPVANESQPAPPAKNLVNRPPYATTGNNPLSTPNEAASKSSAVGGNPFEVVNDDPIKNEPAQTSTVALARNLRMALFGLDELSSKHLVVWERYTSDYIEGLYNNDATNSVTSNAVNDVVASFVVSQVSLSSARRRQLRSRRSNIESTAYLLTYTQTVRYSAERYIPLSEVLQHPFGSPSRRDRFVIDLKISEPTLFGKLSSVSAVFLPLDYETSVTILQDEDTVSIEDVGRKYDSFFCRNSGIPCPMGECSSSDLCVFASDGSHITPVAPYADTSLHQVASPSTLAASNIVDLALGSISTPPSNGNKQAHNFIPPPTSTTESATASQSTPSASKNAPTSGNTPTLPSQSNPSDAGGVAPISNNSTPDPPHSSSTFGPTVIAGLQMTLSGMFLVKVEEILEWQYLTEVYARNFYQGDYSNDYIRASVHMAAGSIEAVDLTFDFSPRVSTTIIFKQTVTYETTDPKVSPLAVVMQPYLTPEYQDDYVDFLKGVPPLTFGDLESISSLKRKGASSEPILLTGSFLCGEAWPVGCGSMRQCENRKDCPSGQECFTSLPGCTDRVDHHQQQQQQQQHDAPSISDPVVHKQQTFSDPSEQSNQNYSIGSPPNFLPSIEPDAPQQQPIDQGAGTTSKTAPPPISEYNANAPQDATATTTTFPTSLPVLESSVQLQQPSSPAPLTSTVVSKAINSKADESVLQQQQKPPLQDSTHLTNEGSSASKTQSSPSTVGPDTNQPMDAPISQQLSPEKASGSTHFSNNDGSMSNAQSISSTTKLEPANQPMSAPISVQQLSPGQASGPTHFSNNVGGTTGNPQSISSTIGLDSASQPASAPISGQHLSPGQASSPTHFSNIDESVSNPQSMSSTVGLEPSNQPLNAPISQQDSSPHNDQNKGVPQSIASTVGMEIIHQPVSASNSQQGSIHFSNNDGSAGNTQSNPSAVGLEPASQPVNTPISQQGSTHLPINNDGGTGIPQPKASTVMTEIANQPVSAPISQQLSPGQVSGPTHLSNNDESTGNPQSIASSVGLEPANQPARAPTSQQLSDIPCDLCRQGKLSQQAVASFDGQQIECIEAYNVMMGNLKENSSSCITARSEMSHSCCVDSQDTESSTTGNGAGISQSATDSPSNTSGQQPGSAESPSSFQGSQPEDPHSSTGIESGNMPDGDQGKGEAQWLVYWVNSSKLSRKPLSMAIATSTSFCLWLSWL